MLTSNLVAESVLAKLKSMFLTHELYADEVGADTIARLLPFSSPFLIASLTAWTDPVPLARALIASK